MSKPLIALLSVGPLVTLGHLLVFAALLNGISLPGRLDSLLFIAAIDAALALLHGWWLVVQRPAIGWPLVLINLLVLLAWAVDLVIWADRIAASV